LPDSDEEDSMDLATKLVKYNISLPQYTEAFLETETYINTRNPHIKCFTL